MRSTIAEYKAVEEAAMKFVKSVAEGDSSYAEKLFTDDAVLFGFLDGKLEHGSIEQFYHNVDTVLAENHSRPGSTLSTSRNPSPWSGSWRKDGEEGSILPIISCSSR